MFQIQFSNKSNSISFFCKFQNWIGSTEISKILTLGFLKAKKLGGYSVAGHPVTLPCTDIFLQLNFVSTNTIKLNQLSQLSKPNKALF